MDDPDNPLEPASHRNPSRSSGSVERDAPRPADGFTDHSFKTPVHPRFIRSADTPAPRRIADFEPDRGLNDAEEANGLNRWAQRSFRFFVVWCDAMLYVFRPFTRLYLWAANIFICLLLARYILIAYGGAVSYACGKPLIHAFLCPDLNPYTLDVDELPSYLVRTSDTPVSISHPRPNDDPSTTFGQMVGEIETMALSMLSLARRSPPLPRTAEMAEILEEIVRITHIMGPGAFAYEQGMTRTVDDVTSLGTINLGDLEVHPNLPLSSTPDAESGTGPQLGAAQPVSDNLKDLSGESDRQIIASTRLKELITKLDALIQEEISDTEQQAIDLSGSVWTRLGGNHQQLKRLRFWRKALKRMNVLGDSIALYSTNLKSTYATSKAKVDDLQQRIQGLFSADGMPFQAKWRSVQAVVLRMWAHGIAGVERAAQDHPDVVNRRIADH